MNEIRMLLRRRPCWRARYAMVPFLVALSLALSPFSAAPLSAEHGATITGQVVNGTAGQAPPTGLEINLHIFKAGGEVDVESATTDGDGRFQFQIPEVDAGSTYAVTTDYQNVLYSSRLDVAALEEPTELLVYETTNSLEHLSIGADVLLIRGASEDRDSLPAFEAVGLVNKGDRTFVPDLTEPARMRFLRFPLPRGAVDLEVGSDLAGGDIIPVDTGFALTAPVTPGSHQVTYTYLIPYEGSQMEFTHSFPMGADTFRLLMEDSVGTLGDPARFLNSLPLINEGGTSFGVWEAQQVTPGTRLNLEIKDLPQPPLIQRFLDSLTDGPYLKAGIPAAIGLVMASLLTYALLRRQAGKSPVAQFFTGAAAAHPAREASLIEAPSIPGPPWEAQRRTLLEAIGDLDDLLQRGEIGEKDHQRRREELKAQLMQLSLASGPDQVISGGSGT